MNLKLFRDKLSLLGRIGLKTLQCRTAKKKIQFALSLSPVETTKLPIDLKKLEHFHQVVDWPLAKQHLVHPCYLHTLAFPLHLKLMLHDGFPLPLLGLVHVNNQIEQFSAVNINEEVALRCYLSELNGHSKGWTFSIISEARIDNVLVWRETSKNLYRTNFAKGERVPAEPQPTPDDYEVTDNWYVSADTGRRYAKVSGDYNPIHLHPWLARLFGFKRHIAHGMWSKAKCLSAMADRLDESFVVRVNFKKPIFLPEDVTYTQIAVPAADSGEVNSVKHHSRINFRMSSSGGQTAHLEGELHS